MFSPPPRTEAGVLLQYARVGEASASTERSEECLAQRAFGSERLMRSDVPGKLDLQATEMFLSGWWPDSELPSPGFAYTDLDRLTCPQL